MPIAYPRMSERIPKEYYIQAPENTPEYVDAYFEYPEKLNLMTETMDREVKAGFGDNVAILYEDEKITYKQLQERANKVGNTLLNLGIGHYDLVCLLSENRPEFIYIYCGIIKIGAIVCPFTPWLRADEIAFEANDSLAKALIVSNAFLGEVEKANGKFETIENIIVLGGEKGHLEKIGAISLDEHTQAASSELETFNTHRDDVCMLLYSSGTTGLQKGTLHTHGNMVGSADSYNSKIQLKRGEVVGGAGTFAFAFPNIFHKLIPLRHGGAISITPFPPFDVEKLIINIERHNISVLANVPLGYIAMLKHPALAKYNISSLQYCCSGGTPAPTWVYEEWKEKTGKILFNGIGNTEMTTWLADARDKPNESRQTLGACGRELKQYEAEIHDRIGGKMVQTGEVGYLAIKGVTACWYWRRSQEQVEYVRNGWSYSGDLFSQDETGYFFYSARGDDIIKKKALRVSPPYIENIL